MKKSNSSAISSIIGIIVVAAILILANWLLGRSAIRADLTEDKRYSLSEGTKNILGDLESPVTIRFYFTPDSKMMPEHMKLFGTRVEDLLTEYANHSNGMIQVETYSPEPDSDAESTARLDGIRGQASPTGEALYLGLAVSCLDATEALPVLSPETENNLEFDLSRAVYRVTHPDKITVAILSTLPVMGSGAPGGGNPFMQQQQQPAWLFVDQLRKDYTVETVDGSATGIPDSVNVLIVHHPKQLGEETLYAIDQFVLNGGKVIALVDPSALMDQSQRTQFGFTPPTPSTLGKLFDAWGVEFDTGKVVADMSLGTPVERGADGRPVTLPAFMTLDKRAVNKDDITCNSLDRIMMPFAGAFIGKGAEGLTKTVLLSSTDKAQLFESMRGQQRDSQMAPDFKDADGKVYDVAIRLTGTFKSAFPNGKPGAPKAKEGEAKTGAKHLATGKKETAVVLIGDADFVHEQFWAQRQNFFGQQVVQAFGDNASFLQNLVEQLSGDSSLVSIRSRGVTNRQLTVIRDMQQAASKEYQEELAGLEKEVQEAQQKIAELQRTKKDASQLTILSPEQQAELQKLTESEAKTQKRRRELSKELRKKIDWLEGRIMIINIGAMPLLITLTGITVAVVRRRRRTAHQKGGR